MVSACSQGCAQVACNSKLHCTPHVAGVAQGVCPSHNFPFVPPTTSPVTPGGMEAIPCTDPEMRATPLDPSAWRDKLAKADAVNTAVEAGRQEPVGGALHAAVCKHE